MMLYIKAFHIITIVTWFAAIFYLPRLFVYHTEALDPISQERFKLMERRLYRGIMWPSAILATILGLMLLYTNYPYYLRAGWMHIKLSLVILLWVYHLLCGHYVKKFAQDEVLHSSFYFRIFNEIPVIMLVGIVIMVVVRPV